MQTDPPQQARPAALKRIGRYRIVRPLSKGGMALVYEARLEGKEGVSPRVAIKVILPEHADSDTFRELFINEARLGASMDHQNLVRIQDFDAQREGAKEIWFLVMEYVEGFTLRKIISLADRHGIVIPMGVIAEIGRQACDGLHFAHTAVDEQGRPLHLVHRDIKPSNLILNPHGVAKVLDFGISKGRLRQEKRGSVKGTWGYMAPEQAVGADIQPTADVFGLATVLYELGSLRPMFLDRSKEDIRRLLRDDHAARMAATLDGPVYGPLIGVLVRALQRDPAARFATAEDFGRALSSLLPDPITARDEVVRFFQQLEALEAGKGSSAPAVVRSQAPAPTPDSGGSIASPPPSRRRPGPVNGVVTFVTGAMLSLGILLAFAVVVLVVIGAAQTSRKPASDVVPIAAGTPPAPPGQPQPAPALAADEPPGPAGEGAPGEERPPPVDRRVERSPPRAAPRVRPKPKPSGTSEPEPPEEEVITVVNPAPEPGEAIDPTAPPPADADVGTLIVDSKQPAEVYIAGQFVDQAPVKKDLPVGRYAVSLVAADGRRRTFDVDIQADTKIRKVWDFDKMEWR